MTRISKQQRLKRTAHHEAGHAVTCFGIRRAFTDLSIVETEESLGVMHHRRWIRIDPGITSYEWESRDIRRIKWDILVSLGGPAAESIFVGRTVRRDWALGSDHGIVQELLDLLYGGVGSNEDAGRAVSKYIEYMEQVVKNYTKTNWKFIERLAHALLAEETLTYKRAKELVNRDKGLPVEELGAFYSPVVPGRLMYL